jgi:hypothetical protein
MNALSEKTPAGTAIVLVHVRNHIEYLAAKKWIEHTAPSNIASSIAACDLITSLRGTHRQELEDDGLDWQIKIAWEVRKLCHHYMAQQSSREGGGCCGIQ